MTKEDWRDAERLLDDDASDSFTPQHSSTARNRGIYHKISRLNIVLLASNIIFLGFLLIKSTRDWRASSSGAFISRIGAIRSHELAPASEAIEYTDVTFTDSGFHAHHRKPNIFEGSRTHEQDEAWMNLTTVGFISLTEEENNALKNPSVESMTHPGTYPVAIGVFHQLHCLNYLRVQLFLEVQKSENAMAKRHDGPATGQKETDEMVEQHKHHCLDYLRQVIQCHGDITPLSVVYREDKSNYAFDHAVTHSCRNFDKIYDWAINHAADVHIEG